MAEKSGHRILKAHCIHVYEYISVRQEKILVHVHIQVNTPKKFRLYFKSRLNEFSVPALIFNHYVRTGASELVRQAGQPPDQYSGEKNYS